MSEQRLDWEDGGPAEWELSSDEILRRAEQLREQRPREPVAKTGRQGGIRVIRLDRRQNGVLI
jgi:hypothetical protein